MIVICKHCREISPCILAGKLHIITDHLHVDFNIPKEIVADDGSNCLTCLLGNTIPISDYYRLVKEGKL